MNRTVPKLIICSVAYLNFIAIAIPICWASQPKPTEPSTKHGNKVVKTEYSDKSIVKKPNNNFVLVPPPPPFQPSFLDISHFSGFAGLSTPFDLFNKDELKQRLSQVEKQIVNAQKHVQENNTQLTEAKDRAERFSSLYTEGVVSHKELEAAQKNVLDQENFKLDAQAKLADLQLQEKAILRRLTSAKQSFGKVKHNNKSKIRQNEKT